MTEIGFLGQTTSLAELIAMLTGLAGVYLTIRQSAWCFPIGIINVTIYAFIFFSPGTRLYADALLQCIYILLLFFGWYKWTTKKSNQKIHIPSVMNKFAITKITAIVIFSSIALGLFFSNYTNASYPWLDSFLTSASLAAQWMIAKKFIENWIVWIFVDILYIPLYIEKNLPLTALLYAVFLLMAVKGFREWRATVMHAK